MSHLIHVVDYKNYLTSHGITCPIQQSELLKEPFTRAIIRYFWACDCDQSATFEERVWKKLEMWNCVSPIPAQQIMACFKLRMNLLRNSMLQKGGLPVYSEFTTIVNVEGKDAVDVGIGEVVETLVDYLFKELENCNE